MRNIKNVTFTILSLFGFFVTACGGGSSGNGTIKVSPPVISLPIQELRILVIGQSISSNCNEYVYGPVDNVFQVGIDGTVKAASDPFEWADCRNGSMWMPLGKKIIEAGIARKVVFMPIGIAATKVEDWQVGGTAFGKLTSAIAQIQKRGMIFDFAFWHQGFSNSGTEKSVYINKVSSVLDYVDSKVKIDRWLIAVHSRCYDGYDRNIEAAQVVLGGMSELRRYPGPNNNLLGNEYRFDSCHLKQIGQEKMALMWLDSVKAALK